MDSWFFKILILGNFTIMIIGFSFNYGTPMPTTDTPGTRAVDAITLNQQSPGDALDDIVAVEKKVWSDIRVYIVWFSSILFVTFIIAIIFSRFGGTPLMTRQRLWRVSKNRPQIYYREGVDGKKIVVYNINKDDLPDTIEETIRNLGEQGNGE